MSWHKQATKRAKSSRSLQDQSKKSDIWRTYTGRESERNKTMLTPNNWVGERFCASSSRSEWQQMHEPSCGMGAHGTLYAPSKQTYGGTRAVKIIRQRLRVNAKKSYTCIEYLCQFETLMWTPYHQTYSRQPMNNTRSRFTSEITSADVLEAWNSRTYEWSLFKWNWPWCKGKWCHFWMHCCGWGYSHAE